MVGLLLRGSGVNHGVELYKENVEYAKAKLEEFKATSKWYDPTVFLEPSFVVGNGLLLDGQKQQYDRVYVGAACTTEECQMQMKNLLEIGGIVVMPTESQVGVKAVQGFAKWLSQTSFDSRLTFELRPYLS